MFDWSNKFLRDSAGNGLVEFALMVPLWLLLVVGTVEFGRAYFQANAVEKGVRAGTFYAARNAFPLTAAVKANAENIVKTGTMDGSGPLLVSGYAKAGAGITITSATFVTGETSIPVIRIAATVPFDPLLPGLGTFVGLGGFTIETTHEQAYVGD